MTCLTGSLSPTQCLLYGVSFPMTIHGAKILNKTGSANGTVSCAKSRSYAALNGVMPPAPRAYPRTILGQIADSGVIRVLQRFCVSYRRVLSCSPIVRIDRSARPLLAELCRGQVSTTTQSGIFAFTFSATTMIEGSLSQRSLNFTTNKFFTKSAPELARQSVAPFASDAIACMHPVLESTIARNVFVSSSTPSHRRLGPFSLRNPWR